MSETRWEYRVHFVKELSESELNPLGDQGWEVCAAHPVAFEAIERMVLTTVRGLNLLLKRPKPTAPPA
jgi:hypothetical protein